MNKEYAKRMTELQAEMEANKRSLINYELLPNANPKAVASRKNFIAAIAGYMLEVAKILKDQDLYHKEVCRMLNYCTMCNVDVTPALMIDSETLEQWRYKGYEIKNNAIYARGVLLVAETCKLQESRLAFATYGKPFKPEEITALASMAKEGTMRDRNAI